MKTFLNILIIGVCFLAFACDKDEVKQDTTSNSTVKEPTFESGGSSTTSSITASGFKISTSIKENGGATITQHGHVWSETVASPTTADLKSELGKTNGPFPLAYSSEVSGLKANTTYNVRPYAINSKGTVYGGAVLVKTAEQGSGTGIVNNGWENAGLLVDFSTSPYNASNVYSKIDNEGNTIIMGSFNNTITIGTKTLTATTVPGGQQWNGFIAKFDTEGKSLWVLQLESIHEITSAFDIMIDAQGNSILSIIGNYVASMGGVKIPSGSNLVKVSNAGRIDWVKPLSTNRAPMVVRLDKAGNYYVGGRTGVGTHTSGSESFTVDFNKDGLYDSYVAKFDADLKFKWVKRIGGKDTQEIYFDVDDNGTVMGVFSSPNSPPVVDNNALASTGNYSFAIATDGTIKHTKHIGNSGGDLYRRLKCWGINKLVLVAYSALGGVTLTQNEPMILASVADNGTVEWAHPVPNIYTFDIDKDNNLYTIGRAQGLSKFGDLPPIPANISPSLVISKLNITQNKWQWVALSGAIGSGPNQGSALAVKDLSNGKVIINYLGSREGGDMVFSNKVVKFKNHGGVGYAIYQYKP